MILWYAVRDTIRQIFFSKTKIETPEKQQTYMVFEISCNNFIHIGQRTDYSQN